MFPFSLSREVWAGKEKHEEAEYDSHCQEKDFLFLVDACPFVDGLSLVGK